MPQSIAVVICVHTLDRWDDILAAIDSVRGQNTRPDEFVVVVDHCPPLFDRLVEELADVTVVHNHRERGLSGARNTGVEVTSSEIVAFLDDDAIADPEWVHALLTSYGDESVAGVGGVTVPRWDTARPKWFPTEFDWTIGCSFTGRDPGEVRNLLGGNASFRREVFTLTGGFPEHMGRTSADRRPLSAEETELCIRTSQRRPGWRFLYEPRALVGHRVTAERARFAYFRSRCYAEGISKARLVRNLGAADGLSAERIYVVRTLTRGVLGGFGDALRGDPTGVQRSLAIVFGLLFTGWGYLYGRISAAILGAPYRER